MTGIGCMMAAGGPYGGTGAEYFYVDWNGTTPYAVSTASGQSNAVDSVAGNVIVGAVINGSGGSYTYTFTITSNPSGKLSLTNANDVRARGVAWSGLFLNETETITVRVDFTDSTSGFSGSDTVSVTVHRNS